MRKFKVFKILVPAFWVCVA